MIRNMENIIEGRYFEEEKILPEDQFLRFTFFSRELIKTESSFVKISSETAESLI